LEKDRDAIRVDADQAGGSAIVKASISCPLCGTAAVSTFHVGGGREFLRCPECALVSLHPDHRPSLLAEVLRYCEHENSAANAGYVQFLSRLADPLSERLPLRARGLDFGCGPEPVLAGILSGRGLPTAAYDPLFKPDEALLDVTYDFVSCSEVLEHVHGRRRHWTCFVACSRTADCLA
jgi:hypothetical protein